MLALRDSIPMRSIRDNGGLWVPRQLSRRTACRLQRYEFIRVERNRPTPKGRTVHMFVVLAPAGLAALEQADE